MATPGRQRPVRPATSSATTEQAALQARIATMTYSFAQQMPQLPSRPSSASPAPPSRPATLTTLHDDHTPSPSDDPNFPLLTSAQQGHQPYLYSSRPVSAPSSSSLNSPRAWETSAPKPSPSPSTNRGARWHNTHGKTATAAEVVASKAQDQASQDEDNSETAKQEAELALYSKLVPTTSAVPRNPGRPLGGGGLRATGSVAAQQTTRAASGATTLHGTQGQGIPRKEPMASRMRSLSSEASKPQLARRIARPSRTASATPPPAPVAEASGTPTLVQEQQEEIDDAAVQSRPREGMCETSDGHLKNIVAVYGKVERETARVPARLEHPQQSTHRLGDELSPAPSGESPIPTSRRLEEAFNGGNRFDNTRSPSPVLARKSQIGALRRSAPSPASGNSLSRKSSGRDSTSSPAKGTMKQSSAELMTEVPPGFEGRTAGLTKAGFMARGKPEGSGAAKPTEREGAPIPPQNARADAFREAINTRRHSGSPRPGSRRNSHSDSQGVGRQGAKVGILPPSRAGVEFERSPRQEGARGHTRQSSFPSRLSPSASNPPSSTLPRSGDGSHATTLRARRRNEEGYFSRRQSQPVQASAVEDSPSPIRHMQSEATPARAIEFISTRRSVGLRSSLEPVANRAPADILNATSVEQGYQYPKPLVRVSSPDETESRREYSPTRAAEILGSKPRTHGEYLNGWPEQRNVVNDGTTTDLINHLLNGENDEHSAEIHAPIANRTVRSEVVGSSIIDRVRQWQLNGTVSSLLTSSERTEEVLPPLPNPEEDVRFESMLRSMGWSPPEEDEKPKNHRMNGVGLPFTQRPARSGAMEIGLKQGLRNSDGHDTQGLYYSHFP